MTDAELLQRGEAPTGWGEMADDFHSLGPSGLHSGWR